MPSPTRRSDLLFVGTYAADSSFGSLKRSSADAADAMTIFLPKVKLGNAQAGVEREGGVPLTLPFQALRYLGSVAGIDQTTIAICDSAALNPKDPRQQGD